MSGEEVGAGRLWAVVHVSCNVSDKDETCTIRFSVVCVGDWGLFRHTDRRPMANSPDSDAESEGDPERARESQQLRLELEILASELKEREESDDSSEEPPLSPPDSPGS